VLHALTIKNAAAPIIEEVQWRGRWGWGWGAPVAAGVVAGALVGGALAAPYYGYGPYYPGPYYPGPAATGTRRRRHLALGIRRQHLAMPRLAILRRDLSLGILRKHRGMPRLAILRSGRTMPCRPALPLEPQWRTARSVTGHTTRKPDPISETTVNVITARERSLREGEALFLRRRAT
jgi:hypothetical protein